ncbi:hypothetical protein BJ165DRAFT_1355710 [Panaeolus papilionaceus]|nr:hypothetical protein BJ165DRAFT_1355710 [Panaeolus papilionaceus]
MAASTLSTVSVLSSTKTLYVRAAQPSTYHPCFTSPDADIILRSTQGTLYRIHSYTLRSTSGFFDTMFSLPQPKVSRLLEGSGEPSTPAPTVLDVYENDFAMEHLLKIMCGLPIPKWNSFDDIERVLTVAEKWDTPGPISSIRSAITSPRFLEDYPLRCYVVARHFGWDAEAKIASTHTLTLNLYDPVHEPLLDLMSSRDVLLLLNLHRKRRDMFRDFLNSPERFAAGNSEPYHCNRCGVTELDNHAWKMFKNAMFLEMEKRPLGDTLGVVAGETADWPEAKACWESQCSKPDCGGLNYDRIATLRQIRTCISLLPTTIEV